ncbi:hypothetical protein L7F22_010023 [Adiantum nelumboides]|nr:hypothetical protein [Adiantum nelumboides]
MEPVGFLGVLKLSILIIHGNSRHFLCIALMLALSGALQGLLLDDTSSSNIRTFAEVTSLAVYLACTPLLTFSVCRACLGKSVDMKGSANGIERSVKNLQITLLCVVTAAAVVVGIAAGVVFAVAPLVGGTAGVMITIAGVLAAGVGLLYVAVELNLAETVAILEESRGWEAMRRSMYLVGRAHKKGVTLGLWLLFVLSALLLMLPLLASDSRWIALSLGFLGSPLLGIFSGVSRVVLYMSCRAGVQEPLDTLVAASAQFGPQLDTSHAKFLDLETASRTSTLST